MPEMDQGIKRLLQTHPADLLALVLPGARYLGTAPTDMPVEPQLVTDALLRVWYEDEEYLVDIEAEARPRPEIARRLFAYGARINIATDLKVLSVVLWLERGGVVPRSPYQLRARTRVLATWAFIGIEVYRLHAAGLLQQGLPGLLPLVAFSQERRDFRLIERTAEVIRERAAGTEELGELEALLAVFAARRFGTERLRSLLRRVLVSTEIIGSSPLYQEWIQEATENGMQQGMQQGMREALLLMLRGRFGEVPADVTAAINAAPSAALQPVLAHAATESLDELRARLGG